MGRRLCSVGWLALLLSVGPMAWAQQDTNTTAVSDASPPTDSTSAGGLPSESQEGLVEGTVPSHELAPGRGDIAPGIYRSAVPGSVSARFELDGRGHELIGVTADTDDPEFGSFSPVCATPCELWFTPGRHVVQLGSSLLRERQFNLLVEDRPKRVRFTRDNVPGIIAGVAIAGAGLIGMIFALPSTITDPTNATLWWGVAGGGLVLLGSGSALTFGMFGYSDWSYVPEAAPALHQGPPAAEHAVP